MDWQPGFGMLEFYYRNEEVGMRKELHLWVWVWLVVGVFVWGLSLAMPEVVMEVMEGVEAILP